MYVIGASGAYDAILLVLVRISISRQRAFCIIPCFPMPVTLKEFFALSPTFFFF